MNPGTLAGSSRKAGISVSSSTSSLQSQWSDMPGATPVSKHRLERMTSTTSSHRSDRDTPTMSKSLSCTFNNGKRYLLLFTAIITQYQIYRERYYGNLQVTS